MKLADELRTLFTPYELAAGGMLFQYGFIGTGFIFASAFHHGAGGLLTAAAGVIVGIVTWFGVGCPRCGKSPLKKYLLGEHTLGGLLYVSRGWPERVCSNCRTPLDTH